MTHRQTEYHGEGPRGTIVRDEHHVLEALSQSERGTMKYTYSSNKCTFSLFTAQTLTHKHTYTPHAAGTHSLDVIRMHIIFDPIHCHYVHLLYKVPSPSVSLLFTFTFPNISSHFSVGFIPKNPNSIIIQINPMSVLFLVLQSRHK